MNREGSAKIWMATTNHFKEGGKDEYRLVKASFGQQRGSRGKHKAISIGLL